MMMRMRKLEQSLQVAMLELARALAVARALNVLSLRDSTSKHHSFPSDDDITCHHVLAQTALVCDRLGCRDRHSPPHAVPEAMLYARDTTDELLLSHWKANPCFA